MQRTRREIVLDQLRTTVAVAVLRGQDPDSVFDVACSVLEGGVRALEVTMTVPSASDVIRRLAGETDAIVGAGSVQTAVEVDVCVDAGAGFIVSPVCSSEVVRRSIKRDVVAIPGAMTPTEAFLAWKLGADLVKVFPAARLGPRFLKDLHGPMPDLPLVPTGGITGENAREYLDAGAVLICLGSWLTNGDRLTITKRAREIRTLVEEHRGRSEIRVS